MKSLYEEFRLLSEVIGFACYFHLHYLPSRRVNSNLLVPALIDSKPRVIQDSKFVWFKNYQLDYCQYLHSYVLQLNRYLNLNSLTFSLESLMIQAYGLILICYWFESSTSWSEDESLFLLYSMEYLDFVISFEAFDSLFLAFSIASLFPA